MFHWQLSFKKGLYSFYFVSQGKGKEKRNKTKVRAHRKIQAPHFSIIDLIIVTLKLEQRKALN